MSFDLFVPGNIDLTKSLNNNLKHLSDTAVRFGLYEDSLFNDSILLKADTLTNESKFLKSDDDLKKVLVLAVEVEYEEDLAMYDLPDEFYSFDITFYHRNFLKIYNNKKPFFRKLKVLTLPK